MRLSVSYKSVFIVLTALLLFTSQSKAEDKVDIMLNLLATEFGIPASEVLDESGNLSPKVNQVLAENPGFQWRIHGLIASGTDPGPVDEVSDEQLIGYIVDSEATINSYDFYISLATEATGSELPDAVRQKFERALQVAELQLNLFNPIAKRRFTVSELTQAKQNARIIVLENEISKPLDPVLGVKVRKKKRSELKALKDKIADDKRIARQAAFDALGSIRDREPKIPNSSLLGVGFEVGNPNTSFDPFSGLMIVTVSGGGVYLVFKDGTALRYPGPPSDMDLEKFKRENPGSTLELKDIRLPKSRIFTPHVRGYTLDIYGEDNTPAVGGPTLRSMVLTKDGKFKESSTRMMMSSTVDGIFGRNASSDNTSGTYFIDGNTIELRYNNGEMARRVFGTDGKKSFIFGHREYTVPKK